MTGEACLWPRPVRWKAGFIRREQPKARAAAAPQPQRTPVMTPSALMSRFSRVGWKSIVTCVSGPICRTVGPAGGVSGSDAGLPTRDTYCAMLQVSPASAVGGAGSAAGGWSGVVAAGAAVSVEGEVAGSSAGVHAISASPAITIREAGFMAKRLCQRRLASSKFVHQRDEHGVTRSRSAWRQHHHHLAAFEPGLGFHLGDVGKLGLHLRQQLHPEMLVRHFAAAEAHGDVHLVALLEKAPDRAAFHVIVVLVGIGPELDFLQIGGLLLLPRLRLFLLLGEALLAVIGNLHDRRIVVGGDLDQIQSGFTGGVQRSLDRHFPLLLALLIDEQDTSSLDILVDARSFLLGGGGGLRTLSYCGSPCLSEGAIYARARGNVQESRFCASSVFESASGGGAITSTSASGGSTSGVGVGCGRAMLSGNTFMPRAACFTSSTEIFSSDPECSTAMAPPRGAARPSR